MRFSQLYHQSKTNRRMEFVSWNDFAIIYANLHAHFVFLVC